MKTFDVRRYNIAQIVEALNDPTNRHATRVEHSCTDEELHNHPDWLVMHFIENGGSAKFSELHRKEFENEVKVEGAWFTDEPAEMF